MEALRIKLLARDGEAQSRRVMTKPAEKRAIPARKMVDMGWRVLGVPFGGPLSGRDADGEAFHEGSEIWLDKGQEVPITYYHGFGPDDPFAWQDRPAVIGKAVYSGQTSRGHWFEVYLDDQEELAKRLMVAGVEAVRASSGSAGHLVRYGEANLIDVWPVAELALFDVNEWRKPANDYAVVEKKSMTLEADGAGEAEAAAEAASDDAASRADLGAKADNQKPVQPVGEARQEESDMLTDEEIKALAGALKPMISETVKEEIKAALPATEEVAGKMVNVNAKYGHGDPDPVEDFYGWIRTGKGRIPVHTVKADLPIGPKGQMVKGALQEGTDNEGGYYVPAGELGRIIAKRDEASLVGPLGATTFSTDRDVFNIPAEGTAMTAFTIVAEEGAITGAENEPVAGQVAVTIYNFKKLIKISEELLEDENSGLEPYLNDAIGRAWGITENYYLQIGSGSSQPQGAFVGGTAGLTLAGATAIAAGEPVTLIGKLKMAYRNGASLVMNRTTLAYLLALTGNQFVYRQPPVTTMAGVAADLGLGYPVFGTENAAAIQASAKSMLFGNWAYYGWVRNRSLRVRRLVELYAGTGQVGILANFRAGGGVLQAEAFQYATHPSA